MRSTREYPTAEHDWAEALIEDAVAPDGAIHEIRLPTMVTERRGWPTPYQEEIRRHVLVAVARGRLREGPVELVCPTGHVAWTGPAADVAAARAQGCPQCPAVPPYRLLVEETFTIPDIVVRDVIARRG